MDRRDNWLETENCFFDATVSENEWNTDTAPHADHTASDVRPSGQQGRVMVIGFHVVRL